MADKQIVEAIIAQFPATFGLRAYPGLTFRISARDSYIGDFPRPGTLNLYTEVLRDGKWMSFAKGSVAELRAEVVADA